MKLPAYTYLLWFKFQKNTSSRVTTTSTKGLAKTIRSRVNCRLQEKTPNWFGEIFLIHFPIHDFHVYLLDFYLHDV